MPASIPIPTFLSRCIKPCRGYRRLPDFFHQAVRMTAWLWSTYGIYWLLTLIPMNLPTREAGVGDVLQDLTSLSVAGTVCLLAGFESLLDAEREVGSREIMVTHYISILVAGYLSLLHPILPVLVSSAIAVIASLIIYSRGRYGSDIWSQGFLILAPVSLSIVLMWFGWPMYRTTWITSLVLWPTHVSTSMPVAIEGCRAALMATLVQGIAAYGSEGI